MTTDLQNRIAAIKAECEEILKLNEKATQGPWDVMAGIHLTAYRDDVEMELSNDDCRFIAHARNVSPAMARVVLMMIDECQLRKDWEAIANQWEGK